MERTMGDDGKDHEPVFKEVMVVMKAKVICLCTILPTECLFRIEKKGREIGSAIVSEKKGFIIGDEFTEKRKEKGNTKNP